jgi:hypothetical protein
MLSLLARAQRLLRLPDTARYDRPNIGTCFSTKNKALPQVPGSGVGLLAALNITRVAATRIVDLDTEPSSQASTTTSPTSHAMR